MNLTIILLSLNNLILGTSKFRTKAMEQKAVDHHRKTRKLSDDENNLQPPSKRVSRSRSPMTCPSPNSITVKGISDRESVLVGATSVLHPDAAMQELRDGFATTISGEMDVLYDPLNLNPGSRTRGTLQNEANTLNIEYNLPSLS